MMMTALTALAVAGCSKKDAGTTAGDDGVIGKPQVTVDNGRFTPEIMWQLGKMGETAVSPDGSQLVYAATYYDMEANKGNAELYLMPTSGGEARRLTHTAQSEFNPTWVDDNTLMFCRGTQIIRHDLASGKESVVMEHDNGFEGFRLSPDRQQLLYIATVPVQRPEHLQKLYAGLDKTTGRINEDLMYRHWDSWVDDYPKIFLTTIKEGKADTSNVIDVVGKDQPYECSMRPWGGIEQFCFAPDGKSIAYTCRKLTGKAYALSTNSDIYLYDIATGETRNLSEGIMGYDQNPVFSHDGKRIAWESMERDGYESDKLRLMVLDLQTGERRDYTEQFDYGVSGINWSADDKELYTVVMYRGTNEVFAFDVTTGVIRQVTKGQHDVNSIQLNGNTLYANQVSQSYPQEVYTYDANGREQEGKKLTSLNDDVLAQCRMGKSEERWIKTTDGKDMLVWLIYPYDYDSTKTYPALLFCEGGPQSMVSQFWSTRWNFQVMSGAGYFVIAPNRRGCPGFGTAWCEEISGDYGGLCMKDYMQSVDVLAKEVKAIDPDRIGACGASFGAFSIYWLAGHNENHRFKAFLAHNGMFNFDQQCLETEEYWFTNWDLGGTYWQKNKPRVRASFAQSPHLFVDRWNTPICVVHSEYDFRIVASQGMAAYNAAQLLGIESRYLYFPDETHWVLKPQNSLLWHRNFIDWFDHYLK